MPALPRERSRYRLWLRAAGALLPCALALNLTLTAPAVRAEAASPQARLVAAALARTQHSVRYDGRYIAIPYPNGDVPAEIGVCTDEVIRSYRELGIDLQQRVHEDMRRHFSTYPSRRIWGLTRPDSNIDHRRVPNLQTYFSRHGVALPVSADAADYRPGHLVTWMLPGNLPHIGIVTDVVDARSGRPLIVHNIGAGPRLEDMLFSYPITGHYRYLPEVRSTP
ncbi:DUF1287 domain-containing protein [Pseudothauera lacus]|uniref:DUF1287 domain-containing protein n=1 Tax=Pseudothauera lacus TaxID=2136175 RepID=A0A2T4IBC3_9RHOO|nr:DUF1287 domain-containing protein [Pseudothauera lacus]PTD95028.1 DUF1287 domain-containing protein [Pseudothauera lacus]